jgi:CelD/BcsL family acetyltransferase involved in cellulose biosynthesis
VVTPTDDGRVELRPLSSVGEVRADWEALALAAGNPFATVEWSEAWLAGPGSRARLRLFAGLRPDGTPGAIVPLAIVRGRYVRKARFLGFGVSNELGPIAAPCDLELGAQALRLALDETRSDWDVFVGENLTPSGWASRLEGQEIARRGTLFVRGPWPSWDDYLATRSRSLRKELRQKERRLQERGLEYRTVSSAEELPGALDALFELHRRRWGEDAAPGFTGQEAFHRAFAEVALARGWLRLRLLELGGKAVAANHSFRIGSREWSYQHGRDPELEHDSVGLLILGHAIREAFAEGAAEFRLGPGRQEYKLRFADGDHGLETVGLARGLRGHASLLAERRRRRT